jgi:hypothetical protein
MLPLILVVGLGLALFAMGNKTGRESGGSIAQDLARLAVASPDTRRALDSAVNFDTGALLAPWSVIASYGAQLMGQYPALGKAIGDILSQRKAALDQELARMNTANPQTRVAINPAILSDTGDPAQLTQWGAMVTANGYPAIGRRLGEIAVFSANKAAAVASVSGDPQFMAQVARKIRHVEPARSRALMRKAGAEVARRRLLSRRIA